MSTIAEFNRNYQSAILGLDNEINNILNNVEDIIIKMQHDRLYDGLFITGQEITPFYTNFTQTIKIEKGQPYNRVTLKDTGSFYEGIFAARIGSKYEVIIDSHDEKSSILKEKYGEKIFGITNDNSKKLYEITNNMLVRYFKLKLGL